MYDSNVQFSAAIRAHTTGIKRIFADRLTSASRSKQQIDRATRTIEYGNPHLHLQDKFTGDQRKKQSADCVSRENEALLHPPFSAELCEIKKRQYQNQRDKKRSHSDFSHIHPLQFISNRAAIPEELPTPAHQKRHAGCDSCRYKHRPHSGWYPYKHIGNTTD